TVRSCSASRLSLLPSCPLFSFFLPRRPSGSTLFPYTTLFRSSGLDPGRDPCRRRGLGRPTIPAPQRATASGPTRPPGRLRPGGRSEEHTSELQSRENLVCRLLLEKKNTAHNTERSKSESTSDG